MPAAVPYPPLYPVILAPLFGLFSVGGAALSARLLNALLAAGAAGLIAWHAFRTAMLGLTKFWFVPAIVLAAALAIPVLATQGVLFAEPLFAVLLALAIVAADRDVSPWIVGSAAALALLTRSIGVAIVAGTVCFLLARRVPIRSLLPVVLPPLGAMLAWGMWVATHQRQIDPALEIGRASCRERV